MKIGCLQFAPEVGDVNNNLNRADAVLSRADPQDLDLLVLPELAFTGYNFRSLKEIAPFLEPTTAGISSLWARTAALKYNCHVTVGYPETVDTKKNWPSGPEYYNSAITVNPEGTTIANYRKSFLYYTDETWALEGHGFFGGEVEGLGNVAMGICMDLNPYKFETPWHAWEFAHHVLRVNANLVIMSMAWLTREGPTTYFQHSREPDMDTLAYWVSRLEPLIRAEGKGEIIVVLANRCGMEDEAVYAGTSAVLGINDGEVKVYGILGRGEKRLLVVDTSKSPVAKLVSEPNSAASTNTTTSDDSMVSAETAVTVPDEDEGPAVPTEDYLPVSPMAPDSPAAYFGTAKAGCEESAGHPMYSHTSRSSQSQRSRGGSYGEGSGNLLAEKEGSPAESSLCDAGGRGRPQLPSPPLDQMESSFLKNDLGPRQRHLSPRPQSTIW